ncbi:MAG: MBL fold metallo-hydrolase [Candidatus Omnitrophota bacterium]
MSDLVSIKSIKFIFIAFFLFVFPLICFPASSEETEKMVGNIHWLGQAGFRVEGSKVIYFDPWKLASDVPKADFIFISHDHDDHFSKDDIARISTKNTYIVTDMSVSSQLQDFKEAVSQIKAMVPGEECLIGGLAVTATASYNTNKKFHPQDSKKLGFIVVVDGQRIYHAGDTDNIPEMKDYRCDIALLPVSGTYVMTAEEAAQAAIAIGPKVAIPMHYGEIVGSSNDAKRFQDLLKGKIEVRILTKNN